MGKLESDQKGKKAEKKIQLKVEATRQDLEGHHTYAIAEYEEIGNGLNLNEVPDLGYSGEIIMHRKDPSETQAQAGMERFLRMLAAAGISRD